MTSALSALPRIRVRCEPKPVWGGVGVYAIDEDEKLIPGAQHICSSPGFAIHDMGFTSEWKHAEYLARYPDGFLLIAELEGLPQMERVVRPARS